jgi:outer membrane protein assembly factor BamA
VPSGDGVLVVVSVAERPRWFVTPTVDYDIDTREVTYGYRFRLRNIGGLNREIQSRGRWGSTDSFSISWTQPWIGATKQSLTFDFSMDVPPDEPGALRQTRLGAATTRYLGDYKRLRRGITGFLAVEVLRRDGTDPGGKVDEIGPVAGLGFFRDTRDVGVDPSRGTLFNILGQSAWGLKTDELGYWRANGDFRFFFEVGGDVTIAGRGATVLTTGHVPDFRKVGVGGGGSIRGQRTDVAIGNNIGRASFELRFPIFPERRFAIPLPFVPKKVSNFDLRIDGELFVDSGAAWNSRAEIPDTRVYSGAGAGLRVFLPVFEVARVELAFDEDGNPTFYFLDGNVI